MMRGTRYSLIFVLIVLVFAGLGIASDSEALRRGKQLLKQRDYSGAEAAFREATEDQPRNPNGWLELGRALSAQQDWDGAIAAYDHALKLAPKNAMAANNLGNVYFRMGVYDRAGQHYSRALELRPDYILALYHYGYVLQQQSQPLEARKIFERCTSASPRSAREQQTQWNCQFQLGVLAYRDGAYESVVPLLETILTANPGHLEARYYLGLSYRQLGRTEESKQQLEIHRELLRKNRSQSPIRKAGR